MSESKEVTRAELEGQLWGILASTANSKEQRLTAARLLHKSIRTREEAQRERGEMGGETP